MNLKDKQKLVNQIQQAASVLHAEGEDVLGIFKNVRELNIDYATRAQGIPKLEPLNIQIRELNKDYWG